MKIRLATVLSLAGVLVAGSAAALVNTQVLRPASPVTPDRLTAQSISQGQSAETTVVAAATTATTRAIYEVGEAGAVTLDTKHQALTIVSVQPNPGWTVVRAVNDDPTTVDVALQSGQTLIEFHAALIFGVVNTSEQTVDLTATTVTTGAPEDTSHHSGGSTAHTGSVAPTTVNDPRRRSHDRGNPGDQTGDTVHDD